MNAKESHPPGDSHLLVVADDEYPRHSEGDIIELSDGRLMLIWGRKLRSPDDVADGEIVRSYSSDAGASWTDAEIIQTPWGDVEDVMSVSLVRTTRGIHLFFIGRGPDRESDTRIYQRVSTDEGRNWSDPHKINARQGYHVMNNARVVFTSTNRLIAPVAYVDGSIWEKYDQQRVICYYSDDLGETWAESSALTLRSTALMEPGIAECADQSLYMTLRTKLGRMYESRSLDWGVSWSTPNECALVTPEAPATVVRSPQSSDLWMIWCANANPTPENQRRTPLAVAVSHDNGATWGEPRNIEVDPDRNYAYASVDVVGERVHLTYYDNVDAVPRLSLRYRRIPLDWFRQG